MKDYYEVEFKSTTYRTFLVPKDVVDSEEEAEVRAFEMLEDDDEVSSAWRENAEISKIS
jgi:hypothetical protein